MAYDERLAQALRELDRAKELSGQWRNAALAFELRAMRVEYVIRMLVAAGHVTQQKVDEALSIARDFKRAATPLPTHPQQEKPRAD